MATSGALERTFRIAVALKGLDGVLEVAGGLALLFVSPSSINHIVRALTAHELAQDPKLWAYPWMIALLLAFIVYQAYQLTSRLSAGLIALTRGRSRPASCRSARRPGGG